ncbi:MAG: hypothetical protein KatS3mg129_1036 [Leptospiraceae bacterium]|nr:MAG: hypothetical protein KatS3mg129_1036 [Leptospiraceae bacterium]
MENILSFLRIRWEAILIYWLTFFIIYSLEFFFPENQILFIEKEFILHFIVINVFSFLLSCLLEFFYFFSKVISGLLLRLKNLWKYSIPSILIFSLFIFPLFDLTELKFAIYHLEGLKGNIYITLFGIIIIISIILILIFPIFYGLNGGFIVIACFFSYFLNKVLLYQYFSNYSFWHFLVFYYLFVYLFYFFLQIRRRWGISLYYEHYYYPKWFILSFLFISEFINLF